MYQSFFGLETAPFSIAPDPRFLYMSIRHREALAHLLWGLESEGGFVLLTGEVGTGKTTLSRCLLQQLPDDIDLAFVINPRVTETELLQTLCDELGVEGAADIHSNKLLVDRINHALLDAHAQGRRTVLVIDEAQNLSTDVLEQIRLLTNLETNERKLLQIILLGQPELVTQLERRELRQLAQRITARFHLGALTAGEMQAYVAHRMAVAGGQRQPFTRGALRTLHRLSEGIPRLANVIADRALLGAWTQGSSQVSAATVRRAAREVRGGAGSRTNRAGRRGMVAAALIALLAAPAVWLALREPAAPPMATALPVDAPDAAAPPATVVVAATTPMTSTDTAAPEVQRLGPAEAPAAAAPEPAPESAEPATTREPSVLFLQDDDEAWLSARWAQDAGPSARAAFAAVTSAWHTPVELTATPPCEAVAAVGLACARQEGNLGLLLDIDRPAVLNLWMTGQRQPRSVALIAADATGVTLASGEDRRTIDRALLERYWRGEATLLWQMPEAYREPLARGERGPTVRALRQALATALGRDLGGGDRFDDTLEAALVEFQRGQGLSADGVAGPLTWIRLNERQGLAVPRLTAPTAAGEDV